MSSNYIRVMDFGSLRDFILPKSINNNHNMAGF